MSSLLSSKCINIKHLYKVYLKTKYLVLLHLGACSIPQVLKKKCNYLFTETKKALFECPRAPLPKKLGR